MKVKSPFSEERVVPWLGDRTVAPGEVVPVPDDQLASWLEAGWLPADDRTLASALRLLDEGQVSPSAVAAWAAPAEPEPDVKPEPEPAPQQGEQSHASGGETASSREGE